MVAAPVTLPIKSLQFHPGSLVSVANVTWEQYEAILQELGDDRRVPRIVYSNGTLELMSPLPAHERPHRMIGYIVTAILDAQEQDWEDFGSTTLKQPYQAGLEPDTSFYIQNAERVRHCQRMDLTAYPPPDLAIESDVTSKTTLNAYEAVQVPEVWVYDSTKLTIYVLQQGKYQESMTSQTFPGLPITEMIPNLVKQALEQGTSTMLRHLRNKLSEMG